MGPRALFFLIKNYQGAIIFSQPEFPRKQTLRYFNKIKEEKWKKEGAGKVGNSNTRMNFGLTITAVTHSCSISLEHSEEPYELHLKKCLPGIKGNYRPLQLCHLLVKGWPEALRPSCFWVGSCGSAYCAYTIVSDILCLA